VEVAWPTSRKNVCKEVLVVSNLDIGRWPGTWYRGLGIEGPRPSLGWSGLGLKILTLTTSLINGSKYPLSSLK